MPKIHIKIAWAVRVPDWKPGHAIYSYAHDDLEHAFNKVMELGVGASLYSRPQVYIDGRILAEYMSQLVFDLSDVLIDKIEKGGDDE